jgi:putative methyltransferase (TIGR04325 family)
MGWKQAAKACTPPLLWDLARTIAERICRSDSRWREYEYIREGWDYREAHPEVRGWNVEDVLVAQKSAAEQFRSMVESSGPLGGSTEFAGLCEADTPLHNAIMIFAYAAALAARQVNRMSMLDWGGGIGQYYWLARALLPEVEIEYHCKDVPKFVEYGSRTLPEQHFHADNGCLNRTYDLVLASSSLQYSREWQDVLAGLAGATGRFLLVTRLPTVERADSFVFVQRPYQYGYNTEYLSWCLRRDALVDQAERSGLRLIREFLVGEQPRIVGAPEQCVYRGFLFRPIRRG